LAVVSIAIESAIAERDDDAIVVVFVGHLDERSNQEASGPGGKTPGLRASALRGGGGSRLGGKRANAQPAGRINLQIAAGTNRSPGPAEEETGPRKGDSIPEGRCGLLGPGRRNRPDQTDRQRYECDDRISQRETPLDEMSTGEGKVGEAERCA
jgi:hypothetical protein